LCLPPAPHSPSPLPQGNGYAAKTGSTFASLPGDRRVVFGFTGWSEPSQPHGCGRALIIPRDITLGADGVTPRISPIPELQALRVPGSEVRAGGARRGGALAGGAQVWVALLCSFAPASPPSAGAVFARVLATPDGAEFTEVGYDFAAQALYVNHSLSNARAPNAVVQRAPAPSASLGGLVNVTLLVDGGLIESFLNGLVTITALVDPSNATHPAQRLSSLGAAPAGVDCSTATSWRMSAVPTPGPPPTPAAPMPWPATPAAPMPWPAPRSE